ncbi:MAG: ATP-binding protein [Candidatus Methylumidiphilus sp.]
MLIQFSVTNYRSIRERQTLSLVAGSGKELPQNKFALDRDKLSLLHSVAIYGGNATGKSNLLTAMKFAGGFVTSSAKDKQKGEPIEVEPFLLSAAFEKAASEFEFIFVQDGIRYQYGFSATKERVTEEYLFAFKTTHAQTWFHRIWNETSSSYDWTPFSKYLKGNLATIKQVTRDNALFVSTSVLMNNEALSPVVQWFQKTLAVVRMHALSRSFSIKQIEASNENKNKIIQLLQVADLEIHDINIQSNPVIKEDLPIKMSEALKSVLSESLKIDNVRNEVFFLHRHNDGGDKVPIDFKDESRGTKALFSAAGPVFDVLEKGKVLAIDEIDSSLHPLLVRFIIGLFHNAETNPNNAQLIFVTHDVTQLDSDLLRRDQVWLVEKDAQQSTTLHSLSDYSPRKQESLQKGYLHGRYGGLPNVGHLNMPILRRSDTSGQ